MARIVKDEPAAARVLTVRHDDAEYRLIVIGEGLSIPENGPMQAIAAEMSMAFSPPPQPDAGAQLEGAEPQTAETDGTGSESESATTDDVN